MKSNPVGWFEIYVQDMARAKTFYESVFQVNLQKLDAPPVDNLELWCFPMDMGGGGAAGALARMDGACPGGGGTLVYFECEDCAVEESRVRVAGGSVQQGKRSIGEYGFISLVVDTEGNMIGLHSLL